MSMAEDGTTGTDAETQADAQADIGSTFAKQLTSFQRDLLLIVANQSQFADGDEHSGAASKQILESHYGKSLEAGRFYPNMNKLIDHGLVEKGALEINDRTHSYTITERGKRELRDYHDWWTSMYPFEAEAEVEAIANGGKVEAEDEDGE